VSNRHEQRERAISSILAAAASILARHGYHGTSMRDLAKATGRGLSSLYTYFPSKEALLFALQMRAFETLLDSADAAVASVRTSDQRLYAFVLNHVRYFTAHDDVMRVLMQEAKVLPARQRKQVRALKERYYSLAESLVEGMVSRSPSDRGRPSRADGIEVERLTYGLFGMLNWVWAWYEQDRHGDARAVARTIHAMATRGLGSPNHSRRDWTAVDAAVDRIEIRSLIESYDGQDAPAAPRRSRRPGGRART
jgi:AcrR family transcriptional regulator